MIDIHCHILPGVDDGSKDLEESLEMAKIAHSEGIKKIVNTSHYHPSFEYETGEVVLEKLNSFNKLLKEKNIDLEVIMGNELYYTPDIIEELEHLDFNTMGNSKHILIEFPPLNVPQNLADIVYEIKLKGYTPILAHVERYARIEDNPNIIYDCIKEGALIQINASSIIGKNGKETKNLCTLLLDHSMVHLVGSDAHSATRRRPLMRESYDYVRSNYEKDYADDLFSRNSNCIIENKDLEIPNPEKYIEKKGFFTKLFKR